jgi:multiple sugar transport system permease protein
MHEYIEAGTQPAEWGTLMTGSAIATLPLVILFVISSKLLISGLTTGAVK